MFSKKSIPITSRDINFYIELATNLSLDYQNQIKKLGVLGDYITNDIASDWIWKDLKTGVLQMYKQGLIHSETLNHYIKIDHMFERASYGGDLFENEIWTMHGLSNHPFWENQRYLAKQILNDLQEAKSKTI